MSASHYDSLKDSGFSSTPPAKTIRLPNTLVLCQFARDPSVSADNIMYRPDLMVPIKLIEFIGQTKPEIIVLEEGQVVPAEVISYWHDIMVKSGKSTQELCVVTRGQNLSTLSASEKLEFGDLSVKPTRPDSELAKDQAALLDIATITIEKIYRDTLLSIAQGSLPPLQKLRSAVLVGAGIESLVTGLILISKGYEVTFVESEQDFRNKTTFSQKGTQTLSVKSQGRQTATDESTPFNLVRKQRFPIDYMSDGGWLSKPKESLSPEEKEWQVAFNTIAEEKPAFFAKATKLSIAMNKLGMKWWDELLKSPELSRDVSEISPIYRVFAKLPSVSAQHRYHTDEELAFKKEHNIDFKVLSPQESAALLPGVQHIESVARVDGSSIDITQLVHNFVDVLEQKGAQFIWGTKAKKVVTNKDGIVTGISLEDTAGKKGLIKADDYVLSTGNVGNALLQGLGSHNKVQGLVGLWATIPNIHGIKSSFKVMASEQLSVSNVTVSADGKNLYVSGGHGYIGLDKDIDLEKGEGAELKKRFLDYIKDMYPDAYEMAVKQGTLDLKSCIRPSTPDGLPIFDSIKAEHGKLLVNIGHNCGGFIIAPIMGWVAEQALKGQSPILKKVLESSRPSINTTIHSLGMPKNGLQSKL